MRLRARAAACLLSFSIWEKLISRVYHAGAIIADARETREGRSHRKRLHRVTRFFLIFFNALYRYL